MNNKVLIYILSVLGLAGCQEMESVFSGDKDNAVELSGVEASVYGASETRAAALDKDHYVGRSVFENNDNMVLTTIKRTAKDGITPIPAFSYHDISFDYAVAAQQTSGSWTRNESTGGTEEKPNTPPDRIYWSDAVKPHTYIGYSVPQQSTGVTFDWNMRKSEGATSTDGIDTYYGSLGDPTIGGYIDYSNDNDDQSSKSGNTKIKYDDLLLTYDDNKVAETGGSVAKLYYHHALANVRVVVKISGFSATSESADARSVVENMILKDMLTMYKWKQMSYGAQALESSDAANLSEIYENLADGHTAPTWDQKKDLHMWIPRTDGTGTGTGKQFTFYGLAVPTTMAADALEMQFTVKYQDPMDPWTDATHTTANMKSHTYTATIDKDIVFRAGWCTTINITLDHRNEKMTVGAEYMDWQFVPTPDEGELKKNSTFLSHTDRGKINIFGDSHATVDDATWLYIDKSDDYTEGSKTYKQYSLRDVYGHYGTADDPFVISTADQLLAFAYEVKGTLRKAGTQYYNIVKNELVTLAADGGFDFTGYYVKLDADITMQMSADIRYNGTKFYVINSEGNPDYSVHEQGVTWPSIGDNDHIFNGTFLGSGRNINKLYGYAFFNHLGSEAIVEHFYMVDAIEIKGTGCIAEVNDGIISACHIQGDVVSDKPKSVGDNSETPAPYVGSIVGTNNGVLSTCSREGNTSGHGTVGALVGFNNGILAICYCAGDAKNLGIGPAYAGVGKFSKRSIAYCCYFNKDLYISGTDYENLSDEGTIGHVAFPLTTAEMQSNKFVNQKWEEVDGNLIGEITDVRQKTDPFYYHWSLNAGINRAVTLLEKVMNDQNKNGKDYIEFHSNTSDSFEPLQFKKTQVEWLKENYRQNKHPFLFIPGTYPKAQ